MDYTQRIIKALIGTPFPLWSVEVQHEEWCSRTGCACNPNIFATAHDGRLIEIDRSGGVVVCAEEGC